jgi:hypothetical protein
VTRFAPAALALCCWLPIAAGCGGADGPAAPREHARAQAPMLVTFKRWAGSDPAEDDIVVRRDRTADLRLIHGGAGGHFRTVRLSAAEWARLRAALAGDPLAHPGPPTGHPVSGAYRYVVIGGGHAVAGDDGRLPARVRRVVAALNQVIDHHAF